MYTPLEETSQASSFKRNTQRHVAAFLTANLPLQLVRAF
jgi:hypothetical protein